MLLERELSQLLLIDYQTRLMPAIFEGAQVLQRAQCLAWLAQRLQLPLWLTEENPQALGPTVAALQSLVAQAGGRTFSKMSFSAVADGLADLLRAPGASASPSIQAALRPAPGNARSLPKHLQKNAPSKPQPSPLAPERNSIVIAGCEAHVCLLQTALELLEEGFEVWVVADACGARSERNRDAALDRLASVGAELLTTEMVAFEWLRSAEHPAFRDVLEHIKRLD